MCSRIFPSVLSITVACFFSPVLNFILLFSDCILTPIITLIYLHVPIVVHVGASQRLMKMSKKTGPHNSSFGTIHAQIHRCLSFFTEVFYLLSVFRFILSSTVFTVFLKLQSFDTVLTCLIIPHSAL